jgi:hypothetical protein
MTLPIWRSCASIIMMIELKPRFEFGPVGDEKVGEQCGTASDWNALVPCAAQCACSERPARP